MGPWLLAAMVLSGSAACSTVQAKQNLHISESGYGSVERAPATPQIDDKSKKTSSSYPSDYSRLQLQYDSEMRALRQKLRAETQGNFVELRIVWEPEFHYLVSFKERAEASLAAYTTNPIFKANTVNYTKGELEAKSKEIHEKMRMSEAYIGSYVDILKGHVSVYPKIYESQIDMFPIIKSLQDDPMVKMSFNSELTPRDAVSPEIAPLIKYFARDRFRNGIVLSSMNGGTIVLREGCFFLDLEGDEDPLIMFQEQMGVGLDAQGYLALINRSRPVNTNRTARVGEHAQWGDGILFVDDLDETASLRKACGPHKVVAIGTPSPLKKR